MKLSKLKKYDKKSQISFLSKGALKFTGGTLSYLYLISISFVILYPLLYVVSMAFRPASQVQDPNIVWIPTSLTMKNLIGVWEHFDFGHLLITTALYSVVSSVLSVISCCLIGYGLARFHFHGKFLILFFLILTLILPQQIVAIPNFLMFSDFNPFGIVSLLRAITGLPIRINIYDNLLTVYLLSATGMGIRSGLFALIFMQFFRGLPNEIEEASYVDGCGFLKTLVKVMLPNALPAIAVVFLFSLVLYWNDTTISTLYFDQMKTVSSELLRIKVELSNAFNDLYGYDTLTMVQAGVLIAIAPMVIVYLFCQRTFVESIATTGLVG